MRVSRSTNAILTRIVSRVYVVDASWPNELGLGDCPFATGPRIMRLLGRYHVDAAGRSHVALRRVERLAEAEADATADHGDDLTEGMRVGWHSIIRREFETSNDRAARFGWIAHYNGNLATFRNGWIVLEG